jgi:hypothetical protein
VANRADIFELLDSFGSLVVGRGTPVQFAERTLQMVTVLTGARATAALRIEQDQPRLFAGRGFDQDALETVGLAWQHLRLGLEHLETVYVASRATDSRIPEAARGKAPASFAILPVVGEHSALEGLLYLDSRRPYFLGAEDLAELPALARVLSLPLSAGRSGRPFPGAAPDLESEKERLVAILSANQWNILRVAKLIGVTRRTVYLRMQRWGIERKKPKKTLKPFLQGA